MEIQRSDHPVLFLSKREKARILGAVRAAELQTSGEIRVHLESTIDGDPLAYATVVFERLGMRQTAAHNGVLIFLAVTSRQFVVLGDEGINAVVPANFWDDVIAEMSNHFHGDRFADGIVAAIHRIGEKLRAYFPYQADDRNELSDEISYGR